MNTAFGLIPVGDDDSDEKKKLKLGEIYKADIKQARNYQFLKKYHSLIHCAWALIPEEVKQGFHGEKNFRKHIEIAAGYSETFYHPQYGFIEGPTSIAFDKMSESTFNDLYRDARGVLDAIVTRYVSQETFERTLMTY